MVAAMIWLTVAEVEDSGGVRALADRAALEARKQVWRDCLAAYEDHHTPQAYAKIITMLRRKLGLKQSVEERQANTLERARRHRERHKDCQAQLDPPVTGSLEVDVDTEHFSPERAARFAQSSTI
jgi:hypothetical protein